MYNLELAQVRGTKAQLTATNSVLETDQLCIETDTNTYTVGDGSRAYNSIRGNAFLTSDERRSADDVAAARISPVLEYRARLSQFGTNDPTVIVFNNTIGEIVWTRGTSKEAVGTLAGAFANGAFISITPGESIGEFCFPVGCAVSSDHTVSFYMLDPISTQDVTDDWVAFVHISIY